MGRRRISLGVRQSIWEYREKGRGIREIGRLLGLCVSIVSREVRRNDVGKHLRGELSGLEVGKLAHERARRRLLERRRGKRKRRARTKIYEHLAKKLSEKWSPEAIARKWGEFFPGEKIGVSTIYRMIKREWSELKKYLPEGGKARRSRVMDRRGKVQRGAEAKRHVSERPEPANNREDIGHLEVDCVVSKRGSKASVVSIIDRKGRNRWYLGVENLEAATVRRTLVGFLHTLPSYQRSTITFDRGSEFAEWPMIERIFPDTKMYFCTAYSPHEKGSVERSNRDLRRFFPKGTDFAKVTPKELKEAETILNNRPMKCLNWLTPNQFFERESALHQRAA